MSSGGVEGNGRHKGGEGYKNIHQIDRHATQKHIESNKVASSYALGCPRAMVVILANAHITVTAMICASPYSHVASPAQFFPPDSLLRHGVLFLL